MAEYELIRDGGRQFGEPPWLRYSRNGWEGAREYLVKTMEEIEAIASIPDQYGTSWGAGPVAGCQVVNIQSRYLAGKDGAEGSGGLTVVHCDFAETGTNGSLPPPILGLKFTVLASQSESLTVHYDLRAPLTPGSPPNPLSIPLLNGDGASLLVGRLTAKVYSYIPISSVLNIARIAGLISRHPVNSDNLTLPFILGTSQPVFLDPGQCQYDGFSHQLVGSTGARAIEIVHDLILGPDFLVRWRSEDEYGNAWGPKHENVIYPSEPLAGLW